MPNVRIRRTVVTDRLQVKIDALEMLICESVIQILDMGAPKLKLWMGRDQDSLAGALENYAAEPRISVDDAFI